MGCVADREGLDQSIGCCRFRLQTGCQCSHSLGVQGIDLGRTAACDLVKQPPGLKTNLMGRAILHLDRLCLVFSVFDISTHLVQPLVQGAAKGDVHFLKAAADAEYRHALVDGLANQRQGGSVTLGVMLGALGAGWALIVMGLDVGGRTGKQDAVQQRQ